MMQQKIGQMAENQAISYLERQGLRLIARNFRCKMGEIDLIMQDKDCIVFTEVRYRKNDMFGGGAASVTVYKQRKIQLTAQLYLQTKGLNNTPCRFDVVTLTSQPASPAIQWFKNAFEAT